MRKPSGKIKINSAGETVIPINLTIPNGCPSSEEPCAQAADKQGE